MPEYTEHERRHLHAMARQQIRLITQRHQVEAVKSLNDVVFGVLHGLSLAGAIGPDEMEQLLDELEVTRRDHLKKLSHD